MCFHRKPSSCLNATSVFGVHIGNILNKNCCDKNIKKASCVHSQALSEKGIVTFAEVSLLLNPLNGRH